jgi:hypothetical protein
MNTVAFAGGSLVNVVGPDPEVQLFFDCVNRFVVPKAPHPDWTLITERFYRRYLRAEELAPAQELMNLIRDALSTVESSQVDWPAVAVPVRAGRLDFGRPDLANVFQDYFRIFTECRIAAEHYLANWRKYRPLRIINGDVKGVLREKGLSLEDYDALEGDPFWKR